MNITDSKNQQPCTIHSVMVRYDLPDDFEEKIAKMIELKIKFKRNIIEEKEYEELDKLQDWYTWGSWRNG